MGNNVVKGVLVAALLIVLSFWIGISAADDVTGSAMIIAAACGIVGMLCIGKNAWVLIFYAVVVKTYASIPLPGMPSHFATLLLMIGVFLYFLTLKFTTNPKFEWRSIMLLDLSVYVLFALLLYAFYRQPAVIGRLAELFDVDVEYVGGREYIYGLIALLGYLAMSAIPVSLSQLEKHVKPIIILTFALVVFNTISGIIAPGSVVEGGEDAFMNERYGVFSLLSTFVVIYLVATKSLMQLITNARYLITVILCACGILLGGVRSIFAGVAVQCIVLVWVKKELHIFFCALAVGLACLYGASEIGVLKMAPFGVQRTLNPIPGLKLDGVAARAAEGSTDYRKRIWQYALDPRTGFIKDYVWGDGYAVSADMLQRMGSSGPIDDGTYEHALTRSWHSGPITMIHGLGIVGLVVEIFITIFSTYYGFVVLRAYLSHKLFPYIALSVVKLYAQTLHNFAVCNSFRDIFVQDFICILLIKVFYCEGVKHGIITPMMKKSAYVPLAVQERQKEEPEVPEYPLPRKLKKLQNKQA